MVDLVTGKKFRNIEKTEKSQGLDRKTVEKELGRLGLHIGSFASAGIGQTDLSNEQLKAFTSALIDNSELKGNEKGKNFAGVLNDLKELFSNLGAAAELAGVKLSPNQTNALQTLAQMSSDQLAEGGASALKSLIDKLTGVGQEGGDGVGKLFANPQVAQKLVEVLNGAQRINDTKALLKAEKRSKIASIFLAAAGLAVNLTGAGAGVKLVLNAVSGVGKDLYVQDPKQTGFQRAKLGFETADAGVTQLNTLNQADQAAKKKVLLEKAAEASPRIEAYQAALKGLLAAMTDAKAAPEDLAKVRGLINFCESKKSALKLFAQGEPSITGDQVEKTSENFRAINVLFLEKQIADEDVAGSLKGLLPAGHLDKLQALATTLRSGTPASGNDANLRSEGGAASNDVEAALTALGL